MLFPVMWSPGFSLELVLRQQCRRRAHGCPLLGLPLSRVTQAPR